MLGFARTDLATGWELVNPCLNLAGITKNTVHASWKTFECLRIQGNSDWKALGVVVFQFSTQGLIHCRLSINVPKSFENFVNLKSSTYDGDSFFVL